MLPPQSRRRRKSTRFKSTCESHPSPRRRGPRGALSPFAQGRPSFGRRAVAAYLRDDVLVQLWCAEFSGRGGSFRAYDRVAKTILGGGRMVVVADEDQPSSRRLPPGPRREARTSRRQFAPPTVLLRALPQPRQRRCARGHRAAAPTTESMLRAVTSRGGPDCTSGQPIRLVRWTSHPRCAGCR